MAGEEEDSEAAASNSRWSDMVMNRTAVKPSLEDGKQRNRLLTTKKRKGFQTLQQPAEASQLQRVWKKERRRHIAQTVNSWGIGEEIPPAPKSKMVKFLPGFQEAATRTRHFLWILSYYLIRL